ncbi:MAG: HAD-IA family hydrolase, partial [Christensenellaceae bacterium]|nr:HAD-IA family hydrolase [Christensenellaceae bacterium]
NYSDYIKKLYADADIQKELDILKPGEPFWRQMDLGYEKQTEGAVRYVQMVPTYKKEAEYAFLSMGHGMEIIPATAQLLRRAKAAGYRAYYLSNFPDGNWEVVNENVEEFKLFDGGVVSFEAHQIKPEPDIYKTLMARYGLAAEECLFIDDTKANTVTAEQLGMQVIHLVEDMDILQEAKKKGVTL